MLHFCPKFVPAIIAIAGLLMGSGFGPLSILTPNDVSVEATAELTPVNAGAGVVFSDGIFIGFASVFPTGPFPVGETTVYHYRIQDGLISWALQTVSVTDTTPPTLIAPRDIYVATDVAPISVDIGLASTVDISLVSVTNDAPEQFDFGNTLVRWVAEDEHGYITEAEQWVFVENPVETTPPPNVYRISASPGPQGGMVQVSGGAGSALPYSVIAIGYPESSFEFFAFTDYEGKFDLLVDNTEGAQSLVAHQISSLGMASEVVNIPLHSLIIKNPYSSDGNWFVGQAHTHTSDTDGIDTAAELEAAYYDAGYDFLVSTDHHGTSPYQPNGGLTGDPDNSAVGKDLLWIAGSELGYGKVHMGAWGHNQPIEALGGIQDRIDAVSNAGGITVLNHPESPAPPYAWDWESEVKGNSRYALIEAFNGKPRDVSGVLEHIDHTGDAIDLADEFQQVWWIGSDDSHNISDPDQFDNYAIIVQTESATPVEKEVLGSAESGNMYIRETATGPEIIDIAVTGTTLTLQLADVLSDYRVTWRTRGNAIAQQDLYVDTYSSFSFQGDEGYVRAEIERIDDGKLAYTQPIFVGNRVDLVAALVAHSGDNGAALIDDDSNTSWSASIGSASFILDLGAQKRANGIRIDWAENYGNRYNYQVDVSDTGEFTGEEVTVVRPTYRNRDRATTDFFDQYTRYVRVTILTQSIEGMFGNSPKIREVEIFDASPAAPNLYVNNLTGDDLNIGDIDNPLLTISEANEKARPGDVVNIMSTGIDYPGGQTLSPLPGDYEGDRITFRGDPVTRTTINGTGEEYGLRVIGARFLTVENLSIHSSINTNLFVAEDTSDIIVQRNHLFDGESRGLLGSGKVTISNNLITGNLEEGIKLHGNSTVANVSNNTLYGNYSGLATSPTTVNATVINNISAGNTSATFYVYPSATVYAEKNCADVDLEVGVDNLIVTDVLLNDPENNDFSLAPGSPCIDTAIDNGVDTDFLGELRVDDPETPNTGVPLPSLGIDYQDVGAVEYSAP